MMSEPPYSLGPLHHPCLLSAECSADGAPLGRFFWSPHHLLLGATPGGSDDPPLHDLPSSCGAHFASRHPCQRCRGHGGATRLLGPAHGSVQHGALPAWRER